MKDPFCILYCQGGYIVCAAVGATRGADGSNDNCVFGASTPQWARASSFTRFLDHTQRRTTVGRTHLGE
jgi:hypothetical protein